MRDSPDLHSSSHDQSGARDLEDLAPRERERILWEIEIGRRAASSVEPTGSRIEQPVVITKTAEGRPGLSDLLARSARDSRDQDFEIGGAPARSHVDVQRMLAGIDQSIDERPSQKRSMPKLDQGRDR